MSAAIQPFGTPEQLDQLAQATAFISQENALLDEKRYDAWLELFTDDATYWWPIKYDDTPDSKHVSLVRDNRHRLEERVVRLTSGFAYAQDPPSRTARVFSVRPYPTRNDDGVLVVHTSFIVTEYRRDVKSIYAGDCTYHLDVDWRIRSKKVRLLDCDAPLGNITILL